MEHGRLQLEVIVDPEISGYHVGSICFETGLSREQASDATLYAYEHHGEGFNPSSPGALTSFFEDILQGRPMPLRFITPQLKLDTVFAIALFLHRDLITQPTIAGTLLSVDLVHRWGLPMYGHIDPDQARFFVLLSTMLDQAKTKEEQGSVLRTSVAWIHDYIVNGNLPHLGAPPDPPAIVNVGSNGFVFAMTDGDPYAAWVELYRMGYLRGFVLGPSREDTRRDVVASRKSPYVEFNLTNAGRVLNEMELVMGEPAEWTVEECWLRSPEGGTLILPSQLKELFLRV